MGWFFEYGEGFWPEGPKKHLIDAQKNFGGIGNQKKESSKSIRMSVGKFHADCKKIKIGFSSDIYIQKDKWRGCYMMWKRSDGVAYFRVLPFVKDSH